MSFSSLLEVIADKYTSEKALLTEKADEILRFLNPEPKKIQATKLDVSIIKRIETQATQLFDKQNGGFNKAPKFPQASTLDLLMDVYKISKDKETLEMALHSLSCMARGGLRDLVEGGFCRYSTDNQWLVPHFEKMTYDNALLSEVYLKAYHLSKDTFYKDVAFETLDFMMQSMSEEGLFYSASDADTQGEEGKYFVYTLEQALKSFEKASIPQAYHQDLTSALHISKEGNFEGKNIISLTDPRVKVPYYDEAISALHQRRIEKRTHPFVDKKILVSWNAMMIKSLFKASRTDSKYLQPAIDSLDTLLKNMYINSELFHSTLLGKAPKIKAFLEDYAYLAEVLIEAYQSTLNEVYLITATRLVNKAIEQYFDKGKWKFSRGEFETDANIYDASYPSSVSTMLGVLYSISSLVDTVYKKFVFKTLEMYSYEVMRQPLSSPRMSRMVIRYLKDDIIIKAKEEALKGHIQTLDSLAHPFSYLKVEDNDGYMLCNSNSCFGHEGAFESIVGILDKR
ncbi:MAG: thioredoxin domain-containing protein [Sulfurovum sp.]|nr:thioredoxin domain-containing protein [Sulfurovum sp.]